MNYLGIQIKHPSISSVYKVSEQFIYVTETKIIIKIVFHSNLKAKQSYISFFIFLKDNTECSLLKPPLLMYSLFFLLDWCVYYIQLLNEISELSTATEVICN